MSESPNHKKIFLSAEWRDLVLLNYVVDPDLLSEYIPKGTALDSFQGITYLSLVGFRFCKTKLRGKFAVPFHNEFEEVNLRFYVRRDTGTEIRRGVVFIKEIVPKLAIALAARWVYGENYVSLPMHHKTTRAAESLEAEYAWKRGGSSFRLSAKSQEEPKLPAAGSLEQYITEHYWGYSRPESASTLEYHVTHAPWLVRVASEARFEGDATALYGLRLAQILSRPPDSAYIVDGSPIDVLAGQEIPLISLEVS